MKTSIYGPLPEIRVDVTFLYKNGTKDYYRSICFLRISLILIFNGLNAAAEIDELNVDRVLIGDKEYVISESEKDDAAQVFRLKQY